MPWEKWRRHKAFMAFAHDFHRLWITGLLVRSGPGRGRIRRSPFAQQAKRRYDLFGRPFADGRFRRMTTHGADGDEAGLEGRAV